MFLLDDILLAPAKGILLIFLEIYKQTMAEYYDKETIYNQLKRLQYQLDIGEISERVYNSMENILVKRLEEIAQCENKLQEKEMDGEIDG